MLLQFSSAQGPEECCIAVEKALACFFIEAKNVKSWSIRSKRLHQNMA